MSSDKTKAELEAENAQLNSENERLLDLVDKLENVENGNAQCPNCGFNAAQHAELVNASANADTTV